MFHCPTCGTQLSDKATKCLVCGTDLQRKPKLPEMSFFALIMYVLVVGRSAKVTFTHVDGNTVTVRGQLDRLSSVTLDISIGHLRIDAGNYDGEIEILIPAGTEHLLLP